MRWTKHFFTYNDVKSFLHTDSSPTDVYSIEDTIDIHPISPPIFPLFMLVK